MNWRSHDGIEWLEAELPGARAAFTTRAGGVSRGPFESLNLGILTDDDPADVTANRLLLADALGLDAESVTMGRQVHGADLAFHDGHPAHSYFAHPGPPPEEVDGQLSDRDDLALLVLVADCLPVALSGEGGIAMLHCGWRGLAGGIVAAAAERIGATAAAVGPGIGPCCFEVGPEVFEAFSAHGDGVRHGNNLDLWQVAATELERAGVEAAEVAGVCTFCDEKRFFSHRRDQGVTGRQAGIAWPTGGGGGD